MDMFHLKSESETKKMLSDFWNDDIEYLVKIRILLKAFPGYSITKLESRNVEKLWQSLSIEQRKNIFQDQYKYQISQI
ncbi:hypothetical protein ES707_04805 [subsurface metagenome]|jgi:hypothetical protein